MRDDDGRRRPTSGAKASIALTVLVLVAFVLAAWSRRWATEDAFINFRIVDQLLAGHGPVYNAGERVEAGTSPLWLVVLAALRLVTFRRVDPGWLAVGAGLVLTTLGLVAGAAGSSLLASDEPRAFGVGWPAGLLVLVALPPMWDFATSGLETSLLFAWLGVCFWLLARRATRPPGPARRPAWALVVIGLGPLIRPELAVFTVAFLIAHVVASRPGVRERLASVGIALAVPVAVQIARMAYFGSVVPNTAIAKEAGLADWSRGLAYLKDLTTPYLLVLPLVILLGLGVLLPWRRWRAAGDRARPTVALAPVVAGLISAVYVARLGGDFMHARMLLPALFGLALPVFVWVPPAPGLLPRAVRTGAILAIGALVVWAAVCARTLRAPYGSSPSPTTEIADERAYYVAATGRAHPITADDYGTTWFGLFGKLLRERAAAGEDVLLLENGQEIPLPPGSGVVGVTSHIGVQGVVAGRDVPIVDLLGLADALGARMELERRIRPGHEKEYPLPWVLARFGADSDDPKVADAGRALACPALVELDEATTAPLDLGLLARNVARSPRLTRLRVAGDPSVAVRQLCG